MSKKETIRATEYTFSECIIHLIRSLTATGLLFYGVRKILSTSFENWILSKEALIWIQVLLIGTVIINEIIPLFGKRYMIKIRVIFEILLLGWIGWKSFYIRKELWTSFHAWFDDYLPYWNKYNKTDYLPYNDGGTLGYALAFTVLLVMICMIILRYVSEQRIFMILPNIAAVCVALLVNVQPDVKSLLVSFMGVLVLYSGGWEVGKAQVRVRIGKQRRVGMRIVLQLVTMVATVFVAGIIVIVTMACFQGGADRIPDYAPKFLAFQQKAEDWIMSFGKSDSYNYDANKADLDNSRPEYHDETIATLYTNQVPRTNLYLKSFCSSTYDNGTWQPLDNSYENEADKSGLDGTGMAELLQFSTYKKMNLDTVATPLRNSYGVYEGKMRIEYANPENNAALLPYLSNTTGYNENLWIEKDAVWRKGDESSVEFKQWLIPGTEMIKYTDLYRDTGYPDRDEAEKFYSSYVMKYDRKGTKDIPMIRKYKKNVTTEMQGKTLLAGDESEDTYTRARQKFIDMMLSSGDYLFGDPGEISSQFVRYANNMARSSIALEVRNQLFDNTSYNLYLNPLPAGTDPIQYFLETGKEGYCMHYASAATLILQELGVPARYASGFVVKQGLFTKEDGGEITKKDLSQRSSNEYVATVKDYCAHAWVEIYMDGIGWIPFEMTPGYTTSDNYMPTDGQHDEALQMQHENRNLEREDVQESEQPTEETESSEQATQKETQIAQKPDTQVSTENLLINRPKSSPYRKIGLIIVLIALLVGILVYAVYRFAISYQKVLLQELQAKHNRNSIKKINRRIYRGLMKGCPMNMANVSRSGKFEFHMRPITDAEYEQKLMKAYPSVEKKDWQHYMEIVKKCAFSHEVITDEEAAFCYRIYQMRHKADAVSKHSM